MRRVLQSEAERHGLTIMKRSQALTKGLTWYFTGKPCAHGHISIRYASGACRDCVNVRAKGMAPPRPRAKLRTRKLPRDEVTPPMIEAGVKACAAYLPELLALDAQIAVMQIYRAMVASRPNT